MFHAISNTINAYDQMNDVFVRHFPVIDTIMAYTHLGYFHKGFCMKNVNIIISIFEINRWSVARPISRKWDVSSFSFCFIEEKLCTGYFVSIHFHKTSQKQIRKKTFVFVNILVKSNTCLLTI